MQRKTIKYFFCLERVATQNQSQDNTQALSHCIIFILIRLWLLFVSNARSTIKR
jgi:hypothetical protein